MFTPFTVRGITLKNRIVMSPMAMYSAQDGVPGDFHLVHLGSRALGGAGLVFGEMTCPSPDARITPGCTRPVERRAGAGLATPGRLHPHRVRTARSGSSSAIAGRKGSTRVAWEGIDEPLESGNWPLISASAIPYQPTRRCRAP